MSNKTFLISVLALFMTLAWVLEASALWQRRRSVHGVETATGIKTKELDFTEGVVLLRFHGLVSASWMNPAGNVNPNNLTNFRYSASVTLGAGQEVSEDVVKNGRALLEFIFTDNFLYDFGLCAREADGKTPNLDWNDAEGGGGYCLRNECLEWDDQDPPECVDLNEDKETGCLLWGGVCLEETGYDCSLIVSHNTAADWCPELIGPCDDDLCTPEQKALYSWQEGYDGYITINRFWADFVKQVVNEEGDLVYEKQQNSGCYVLEGDENDVDRDLERRFKYNHYRIRDVPEVNEIDDGNIVTYGCAEFNPNDFKPINE